MTVNNFFVNEYIRINTCFAWDNKNKKTYLQNLKHSVLQRNTIGCKSLHPIAYLYKKLVELTTLIYTKQLYYIQNHFTFWQTALICILSKYQAQKLKYYTLCRQCLFLKEKTNLRVYAPTFLSKTKNSSITVYHFSRVKLTKIIFINFK